MKGLIFSALLLLIGCSNEPIAVKPTKRVILLDVYNDHEHMDSLFKEVGNLLDVQFQVDEYDINEYQNSLETYYENQYYLLDSAALTPYYKVRIVFCRSSTGLNGFTPKQDSSINIYPYYFRTMFLSDKCNWETFAHELGHLAQLRHTFELTKAERIKYDITAKTECVNLMSYDGCAREFTKPQLDQINHFLNNIAPQKISI